MGQGGLGGVSSDKTPQCRDRGAGTRLSCVGILNWVVLRCHYGVHVEMLRTTGAEDEVGASEEGGVLPGEYSEWAPPDP